MKKTFLATAIALAFGFSGAAFADQKGHDSHGSGKDQPSLNMDIDLDSSKHIDTEENSTNKHSGAAVAHAARSAALNNGSWGSFSNAFNQATATAASTLTGTVSGNHVMNVGNSAHSFGSADGGHAGGGEGGGAGGGKAMGMGIAGKGGSAYGALGGSSGEAETGDVHAHTDDRSDARNGDSRSGNGGEGGTARGGAGGEGSGGINLAAGGTGGRATGGSAGDGGEVHVSSGIFSMANTMMNVGQSAAGIMTIAQNSGISALVQQSVNVQANLSVR